MDGSREEVDGSLSYYLDFMDVEGDSHCEQCVSDAMSGEHVDEQSSTNQPCSSAAVQPLPIDVPDEEVGVCPNDQEDEAQEQGGNENLNEDESMSDGRVRVHPLLFPDVIRDVLNHLPAKDVEACRLVCRAWNAEACTVLQTKRLVVFVDADAVRVYNNAMRDTNDFPHAQYEFCIQDFTGLCDENLREFWTLFGPRIKSLEFRQMHLFWGDFLEVVGEKVPQLEKLFLRHLPRNIRTRNVTIENHRITSVKELRLASLPTSTTTATERLTDLLKALPNLEVIEFLPIKSVLVKTRVSGVLTNILRLPDVNLPQLKRLNLSLELSNDGVEGLATKHFQLETLDITLANGVKATSFKDLLNSFRPSLSELKIYFPDSFSNYQSFVTHNNSMKPEECVQVLSNLKTLSMTNFKGSINFVQKLPKLQHLEFTTSNLEKAIPFGFKMVNGRSSGFGFSRIVDHSLKFLKIASPCAMAETLTLESISRCFPYLTCLHLQDIDDDGLGVIYRNLPFLSDVEFTKATCTDQGLTGIPLEICNDMVETSTFIVVQAERYRRDLFIGSLQFLQKFSIVATKISDASIALGLVDCKNLKDLKIGSPLITDTGVIFVTDKFYKQLNILDVTECAELTEQSKFYAREKLIGKLKVADSSQDSQTQTKLIKKAVVFNADRVIVKTKRATTSSFGSPSTSSHSKYHVQDTEFFEEHSEDDIRERGFPHGVFPAEPNNRLRIFRIREALRRNGDFMRTLQRMGLQQFRRLYEREFQENQADGPLERNMLRFRPRNVINIEIDVGHRNPMENNNNNPIVDEQNDGEIQPVLPALFEEDDGGPAAGDMGPDRLPEIHLAEIFRLGLRLEDVEYWLRNRLLFERDENNGNPNIDPPIFRRIQADVLLAEMNLVEEAANGGIGGGDDEDIDLEAIRRVVMNAFGDDLPFEG